MSRSFDSIIVGGDPEGLVAAIALAERGSKVLLLEPNSEPGGIYREIEFAPGFRAAPLAHDAGYIAPEVAKLIGALPAPLAASDPAVISLAAEGEPLLLRSSIAQTAEGLRHFSQKDSQQWPVFAARMAAVARFLGDLYRVPPPRIDAGSMNEFFGLAKLGRSYRGLGTEGMVDLLRTLPIALADLLDDNFITPRLKGTLAALGVMDVCQGPIAGGTAFTLAHRHVGAQPGVFSERARFAEGGATLVSVLAQRAQALGVTIQTSTGVSQVLVRGGVAAGVVVESGEEIAARTVVSSLDPWRSLLELIDPVHLDPELIHAVRNIRFRGVTTKVLLALESLPEIPAVSGPFTGAIVIAPDVRYVERAYDATKYGRCSDEPVIELRFPSVLQPALAPNGQHVAVMHIQFTPYRLRDEDSGAREAVVDRAIATVDNLLPGFAAAIRELEVLSPADLEARFGVREGALSQGEMMLDQILFMRPVPGMSRYATPIPGYFLCGAGVHPGAGITGMSGLLASRAALAD
jgi:phytoene dehydrogenase-like protein